MPVPHHTVPRESSSGVSVPPVEEPERVFYTVTLKRFWYNADESLQSKVGFLMPSLHVIVGGEDDGGTDDVCPGLAQQWFD